MSQAFPTPYRVQHLARLTGGVDEMGDPIPEGFAAPVEKPVYGWAPPTADQSIRATDTGVKRDYDLYSPDGFTKPRDRVSIEGMLFDVVGWPEDFNHGPFGWKPGYRINLVRVEG